VAQVFTLGLRSIDVAASQSAHCNRCRADGRLLPRPVAITDQIHGKPAGTTAKWSNPASRNSGSIELVKKLVRNKQQCQEIAYTVRSGGPPVYTEHYHFTSCLQPDGTWKIA
jgi:hypothetical protein